MREILFRGKRKTFSKPCGEWIEGYISVLFPVDMPKRYAKEKIVIIPTGAECNWFNKFLYDVIEVDPETVGQYIGLTDKNGKKIFEGDIIQTKQKGLKGEKIFRFVIKYGAYTPLGYCKDRYAEYETIGFYAFDGLKRDFQLSNCPKMLEVIGNIHDNPELLEQ